MTISQSSAARILKTLWSSMQVVWEGHGWGGSKGPAGMVPRLTMREQIIIRISQIVKVDHREPGGAESWPPDAAAEVTEPQRSAFGAGEHEPVVTGRGVGDDVRGKVGSDHLGDGHHALTGV